MSYPIFIQSFDDLPCEDWKGTGADVFEDCPMKKVWKGGECSMCDRCGWEICYDVEDNDEFEEE